MGYVFMHAPCIGCSQPFAFNPMKVPSLMWNGKREPICRHCVERANPTRVANGLHPIVPDPEAYEPCDEYELPE